MEDSNALLSTPLLQWVFQLGNNATTSCKTVQDLVDGIFLNEVVCNISRTHFQPYVDRIRDEIRNNQDRKANLSVLLESITNFYQDVLSTIVVMELPIVDAIVRDPHSEEGLEGLRKFCLLMLGCAVKCGHKERYIAQLKELPADVQLGLMDNIKEIFNGLLDAPFDTLEELEQPALVELCRMAFERLNTAVADRDTYAQRLNEANWLVFESSRREASQLDELSEEDSNHLQQLKQQLQLVAEELDVKVLAYEELLEDHDARRNDINLLTAKVRELQAQADDVQGMRDDLDVWKSKAKEGEKFRAELARYHQKLEDYDYTTKRFQEIREQNELLQQQVESQKDAAKAADALHDELATQERLAQTLKIQLAEMREAQDSLLGKERQLQTASARKDEQLQELRTELASAKQKLQEAHAASSADLANGDTVPLQDYLRMESDLQQLQLQLEDMRAFADEAKLAREDVHTLQAALKSSETQLADLREEQRQRMQKQANLQRTVDELEAELEKVQGQADGTARSFNQAYSDEKRRMEALEDRLDVALSKSLQLKEERIQVLEARLSDANKQLDALRTDVEMYQRHNDMLRQSARDSPLVVVNSPRNDPDQEPKAATTAYNSPLVAHCQDRSDSRSNTASGVSDNDAVVAQLRRDNKRLKRQLVQQGDQVSSADRSEQLAELDAEAVRLRSANERLKDSLDRHRTKLKSTEKTKAKLKVKLEHYAEKAAKNERLRKRLEAENIELAEQMNKVLMKNRQLAFQKQDLEQTLSTSLAPVEPEEDDINIVPVAGEEKAKRKNWFKRIRSKPRDLNPVPDERQDTLASEPKLTQRVLALDSPAGSEPGSSGNPFSPGSQLLGLNEILQEGRAKTAVRGFGKTPSHPPAATRLKKEQKAAVNSLTGSPAAPREQSALEFLLNTLEQEHTCWRRPQAARTPHGQSEPERTLSKRRSQLLSGASRRGRSGPPASSLRQVEVSQSLSPATEHTPSPQITPLQPSFDTPPQRPVTAPITARREPAETPETVQRTSSMQNVQSIPPRTLSLGSADDPSWDDEETV
eukprot:m.287268 g.287268  ORF g.287268 m.287268 type:complete len:1049 (-) comp17786_c0_seq8:27-3173(-)